MREEAQMQKQIKKIIFFLSFLCEKLFTHQKILHTVDTDSLKVCIAFRGSRGNPKNPHPYFKARP